MAVESSANPCRYLLLSIRRRGPTLDDDINQPWIACGLLRPYSPAQAQGSAPTRPRPGRPAPSVWCRVYDPRRNSDQLDTSGDAQLNIDHVLFCSTSSDKGSHCSPVGVKAAEKIEPSRLSANPCWLKLRRPRADSTELMRVDVGGLDEQPAVSVDHPIIIPSSDGSGPVWYSATFQWDVTTGRAFRRRRLRPSLNRRSRP